MLSGQGGTRLQDAAIQSASGQLANAGTGHATRLALDQRQGRLLGSEGEQLVQRQMSPMMRLYGLRDTFLSLVQLKWPLALLVVACVYCVSWLVFASLWFALDGRDRSCLSLSSPNDTTFNAMFIFSVMVQTTVGFGNDFIRADCRAGSLLLAVQSVAGLILDAFLLGLVLIKASRAKSRAKLFCFSRRGVVCKRDGVLCLLWRLADLRMRSVCEAHVRAYCYRQRRTREGEELDWECHELDLGYDTGRDRTLLLLPITACHYITESSPFFVNPAPEEPLMLSQSFEIVLVLEGVIEATGLTTQAMMSYTNHDILWGHQFVPMVERSSQTGRIVINYAKLSQTRKVNI